MKSKLWILFKNITVNNYKFNKKFSSSNIPKTIFNIILALLVSVVVIAYSALYSYLATSFAKEYNLEQYIPMLFYLVTQLFIFMFSIYRVKSMLFDSSDNDMLFSMPLKPQTILASRMLTLLSVNYVLTILIYAPSLVIYGMVSQITITYILGAVISVIFLPFIPTVLSSIVGYIIAFVSSKVNSKKIIETIVTFIMFILVFVGVSQIQSFGTIFINNVETIDMVLNNILIFPGLLFKAMYNSNILALIAYIVLNIILFFVFCFILSKGYKNIINRLKEIKKVKKKGEVKFEKTNNITLTLIKKEFRRYISIPVYVVNTFFGMILLILFAGSTIFIDKTTIMNELFNTSQNAQMGLTIFPFIIMVIAFTMLMSNTAGSSISLEGKNLWILKTLPVDIKKVLKSKVLFNILVILPISIISLVIVFFTFNLTLTELLIGILFEILISIFVGEFGIIINLKYPKINYINETQVVKQSLSSFLCVMLPMVVIMVMPIIYFIASYTISINVFVMIICGILLLINALFYLLINTWGVKKFNKL